MVGAHRRKRFPRLVFRCSGALCVICSALADRYPLYEVCRGSDAIAMAFGLPSLQASLEHFSSALATNIGLEVVREKSIAVVWGRGEMEGRMEGRRAGIPSLKEGWTE